MAADSIEHPPVRKSIAGYNNVDNTNIDQPHYKKELSPIRKSRLKY